MITTMMITIMIMNMNTIMTTMTTIMNMNTIMTTMTTIMSMNIIMITMTTIMNMNIITTMIMTIIADAVMTTIMITITTIFTSWGKETVRKFSRAEIEEILKTLSEDSSYGVILRAKGMLPSPDGTWIYFDMVPEEYEIREGQPEYTGRLCVIGSKIDEAKLEKLFML